MFRINELFPRAIVHIDCDCFFAACEVAKNPRLKEKAVVVGQERGIATAITYEAKAKGVVRGMRMSEIQRIDKNIIILPADYETYSMYSKRLFEIVRRYTPHVEEYGIDECFAEITGQKELFKMSYQDIARKLKKEIESDLNITVSIGLASTKVLAKVASKWQKPAGLTFLPTVSADIFLGDLSVNKIWGIGNKTSKHLKDKYVFTALDFINQTESWVVNNFSKNLVYIWKELRGENMYEIDSNPKTNYGSIRKSRTFLPTKDKEFLFAQLSQNLENACIKARRHNLSFQGVHIFLKTQDFKYQICSIKLTRTTDNPAEIIDLIQKKLDELYTMTLYRSTGVVLYNFQQRTTQLDLFGEVDKSEGTDKIYRSIDKLSEKYGKNCVFLASSSDALLKEPKKKPERADIVLKGENKKKRLKIPYLGDAS